MCEKRLLKGAIRKQIGDILQMLAGDQSPLNDQSCEVCVPRRRSCLDLAGCATLTGSEAGNVSSRPASSEASALLGLFGFALPVFAGSACLSGGAGLKPDMKPSRTVGRHDNVDQMR